MHNELGLGTRKSFSPIFPLTNFSFCYTVSLLHIIKLDIVHVESLSRRKSEGVPREATRKRSRIVAPAFPRNLSSSPSSYRGERHGYGIMQETALRSDGKVNLGPGTLYRSLRCLLTDGLIEESDERPVPELDDERRHYYRLTPFGLRVARGEAQRLAALVRLAQSQHLLPQPGVVTLEGGA